MASAREKIEAEFENIERLLADLPETDSLARSYIEKIGDTYSSFKKDAEKALKE